MKTEQQLIKIIGRMQDHLDKQQKQIDELISRPIAPVIIRERDYYPAYPTWPYGGATWTGTVPDFTTTCVAGSTGNTAGGEDSTQFMLNG